MQNGTEYEVMQHNCAVVRQKLDSLGLSGDMNQSTYNVLLQTGVKAMI